MGRRYQHQQQYDDSTASTSFFVRPPATDQYSRRPFAMSEATMQPQLYPSQQQQHARSSAWDWVSALQQPQQQQQVASNIPNATRPIPFHNNSSLEWRSLLEEQQRPADDAVVEVWPRLPTTRTLASALSWRRRYCPGTTTTTTTSHDMDMSVDEDDDDE